MDNNKLDRAAEKLDKISKSTNKAGNSLMSFGCSMMFVPICIIILIIIWAMLK
ncbi:hypothetical protein JOD43_002089 [Pullulanibacillus pueri]|uniref:Uncharacterized protein n=1 Tax=Pullulanibacillus pueri TaxID=1437324 RepID=A0A8J3EMM5_9BACL|nr:hypothetical protein [Pullulanibacillus pueri]MBM7681917.1 hypothetical protein [Pullulanibacillus pueri]GGH83436.1 hypothetical protein GCM10007096_24300 [Pullulanibacillus pueri]